MPRYGDSDYDPDFDDSPPPSPKRRLLDNVSPPSTIRLVGRKFRQFRTILLTFGIIAGILYLWTTSTRPLFRPKHEVSLRYKNIDWKLYAYSLYATDSSHLCNALMVFEALERLGSKAERFLMFPDTMDLYVTSNRDRDSQLLQQAMSTYRVKLIPTKIEQAQEEEPYRMPLSLTDDDQIGWDRSISKMLVFNQTQYLRIIHLDNDITLYKNLDDLFFLPSATVAMPRAYWLSQKPIPTPKGVKEEWRPSRQNVPLSPHLMVIEPSVLEAARIRAVLDEKPRSPSDTSLDVAILNQLYKDTAMVLPHRGFALQSGEFRRSANDHQAYLGQPSKPASDSDREGPAVEKWDARRALRETRLVHFTGDEPLPKPWVMWPKQLMKLIRPQCGGSAAEPVCDEQVIWDSLYQDFRKKRKEVCKVLSVIKPMWYPEGEKTPSDTSTTTTTTGASEPTTIQQ